MSKFLLFLTRTRVQKLPVCEGGRKGLFFVTSDVTKFNFVT